MTDPQIFIRRRESTGRIVHSQRIDRYWKNKLTGTTVQVVRYLNVVGAVTERRIVFIDPDLGPHEMSMEEQKFREMHESVGNMSSKF